MSESDFIRLARRGNLIPVCKEILADLETPVSAYLKIARSPYSFLLESVEGHEKVARFSFLGSAPSLVFESKGNVVRIIERGRARTVRVETDPLAELKKIFERYKAVAIEGLPSFCGGFVGYMSYDTVRFFERIPSKNPDDLAVPDCLFILADTLLIFDHINHTIKLVSNVFIPSGSSLASQRRAYRAALVRINALERALSKSLPPASRRTKKTSSVRPRVNLTKSRFLRMVTKAQGYIQSGDIIQAVLSQRFSLRLSQDPFLIYRRLRSVNPSPYMFYFRFDRMCLMGSSPELLVRCENGIVQTRPIAGTRPRGRTSEEDKALETELLHDAKERAEHVMLVDLGRNDLGRVCAAGSVHLEDFMTVERYSHVMHIVTEVCGRLRKDKDIFDALRACFPAGTVTGAPKIRAMEIIEELENVRRGPYAGAVGYFSFSGNLDTCITIRSVFVKGTTAYIQAGAGIVADSVPEREYRETINKAKAQLQAVS